MCVVWMSVFLSLGVSALLFRSHAPSSSIPPSLFLPYLSLFVYSLSCSLAPTHTTHATYTGGFFHFCPVNFVDRGDLCKVPFHPSDFLRLSAEYQVSRFPLTSLTALSLNLFILRIFLCLLLPIFFCCYTRPLTTCSMALFLFPHTLSHTRTKQGCFYRFESERELSAFLANPARYATQKHLLPTTLPHPITETDLMAALQVKDRFDIYLSVFCVCFVHNPLYFPTLT